MPEVPLPAGAIARLGTTAYRLPSRSYTVFLMPPHFSTFVAEDSASRVYREYDIATGLPVRVLLGPDLFGEVSRPSSDGTRIAVQTSGGLKVVDLAGEKVVFTDPTNPEKIARFELSPTGDRLAVLFRNPDTEEREADYDMEDVFVRTIVVHDIGMGGLREIHPLVNFNVGTLFSADGRYIATAGRWCEEFDDQLPPETDDPPPIQIWDTATGAEVARIVPRDAESPYSQVQAYLEAAAGGCLLLSSTRSPHPFGLYRFATGELVRAYQIDHPEIDQFVYIHHALSPDAQLLAGHASNGQIMRRNARTGDMLGVNQCPRPITGRPHARDLTVLADGSVIALRVDDQSVNVWTAPEGRALSRLVGGAKAVKGVRFANGAWEIQTVNDEGRVVYRWDADSGELLGEISLPDEVAKHLDCRVWLGPGNWLLAWGRGEAVAYNLASGEVGRSQVMNGETYHGFAVSPDGLMVNLPCEELGEGTAMVRVEHIADGRRSEFHRFDAKNAAAGIDRDRVLLVADSRNGQLRTATMFDVETVPPATLWTRTLPIGAEFQQTLSEIDFSMVNFSVSNSAVVWAPDGDTALVVPEPERVPFLLDTATGDVLGTWETAIGWPHSAHPSRPILATATANGVGVMLADWRTGAEIAVVHTRCYPHSLGWSPDGTRLVVGLSDGTALVFGSDLGAQAS